MNIDSLDLKPVYQFSGCNPELYFNKTARSQEFVFDFYRGFDFDVMLFTVDNYLTDFDYFNSATVKVKYCRSLASKKDNQKFTLARLLNEFEVIEFSASLQGVQNSLQCFRTN